MGSAEPRPQLRNAIWRIVERRRRRARCVLCVWLGRQLAAGARVSRWSAREGNSGVTLDGDVWGHVPLPGGLATCGRCVGRGGEQTPRIGEAILFCLSHADTDTAIAAAAVLVTHQRVYYATLWAFVMYYCYSASVFPSSTLLSNYFIHGITYHRQMKRKALCYTIYNIQSTIYNIRYTIYDMLSGSNRAFPAPHHPFSPLKPAPCQGRLAVCSYDCTEIREGV